MTVGGVATWASMIVMIVSSRKKILPVLWYTACNMTMASTHCPRLRVSLVRWCWCPGTGGGGRLRPCCMTAAQSRRRRRRGDEGSGGRGGERRGRETARACCYHCIVVVVVSSRGGRGRGGRGRAVASSSLGGRRVGGDVASSSRRPMREDERDKRDGTSSSCVEGGRARSVDVMAC